MTAVGTAAPWIGPRGRAPAVRGVPVWKRGTTWLAVALAAGMLLLFRSYVPLNMDELVEYQTLACLTHPFSGENTFNCPCAGFYLRVFGHLRLPLLSYDYIGSLSSLLYAPLYFVWPSPVSARLDGVIALAIQALVLGRMFGFRPAVVFCCLLLFVPYAFVHIADTGPVAFQTTAVLLVAYLLRRWILGRRRARRAAMAAAAGLLIALACWVKPTVFFISLGLAVTLLTGGGLALARRRGDRARRLLEAALLTAAAAGPALLIYQARRPDGGPYLPVLTAPDFVPSQVVFAGLADRFRANILPLVANPMGAVASCFDVHPELPVLGIAALAVGIGLLLAGACWRGAPRRHRAEVILNAALFAGTLLLIATNLYAKSMHHAVLAYPFALLAAARSLRLLPRPVGAAALAGFLALQAPVFALFPAMAAASRAAAAPKAFAAPLNDELSRRGDADTVVACADWGIYFIKALYGPREQVVLSLRPVDDPGQLPGAAAVARRLHRDLTLVALRNNAEVRAWLRAAHPDVPEEAGPGAGSPWRIWRIPRRELEAGARPLPAGGPPP